MMTNFRNVVTMAKCADCFVTSVASAMHTIKYNATYKSQGPAKHMRSEHCCAHVKASVTSIHMGCTTVAAQVEQLEKLQKYNTAPFDNLRDV